MKMTRFVAFLSVIALLFTMAACGGSDSKQEVSTQTVGSTATQTSVPKAEPVTITIFANNVGGNGVELGEQNDPVAKEIENKLGIKISIYKNGSGDTIDQILGTMLASNDLADIQYLGRQDKHVVSAIKAQSIISLDDLMSANAPNLSGAPDLKLRIDQSRKKFE